MFRKLYRSNSVTVGFKVYSGNFSKKNHFLEKRFELIKRQLVVFRFLVDLKLFSSKIQFFILTSFWKKLLQGTKFETNHMWSNYTEGLPPKLIILSPGGSSAQERNKTGNNFQFSHNSEFSQGPQCRKPDAEPTRDIGHPVWNLVDQTSVRRNLTR